MGLSDRLLVGHFVAPVSVEEWMTEPGRRIVPRTVRKTSAG
jgi:hypothetical protein